MFSRVEQTALREMIAEREKMRARLEMVEGGVHQTLEMLERRLAEIAAQLPLKRLVGTKREAERVRQ
jgi:hypothetical protein